jgi:hypothetical protein
MLINEYAWETERIKTRTLDLATKDLVLLLWENETIIKTATVLNVGRKSLEASISRYIPELPKSKGRAVKFRIQELFNLKNCSSCALDLDKSLFTLDNSKVDKLSAECKRCAKTNRKAYRKENYSAIRSYEAKSRDKNSTKTRRAILESNRRASKLKATPAWYSELDKFVLEEAYSLCKIREQETGLQHHVDHIIPLKGNEVCGLHYYKNWQVIPAKENIAKSNKLLEKYKNG